MVMRVQKIDERYQILLTAEVAEALELSDGSEVEVTRVSEQPTHDGPSIRYVTTEEALAAYRATLPRFRNAYEELAK